MYRFVTVALSPKSAQSAQSASIGPIKPSRRRLDIDTFVGFACVALLPVALWFA